MEKSMERGKGTLILTAAGLAACAVFFVYGIRNGLFTSEEAMAQFLSGLGMWGPFVFVALQVVQVVIPIMPGGISCLAGVLLFGPVWGFLYNYVGICIGSVLAFQIARRFGMPAVERAAGSHKIGRYLKWMENGVFDRLFAAAIFSPQPRMICSASLRSDKNAVPEISHDYSAWQTAFHCDIFSGLTVIFDQILRLAG